MKALSMFLLLIILAFLIIKLFHAAILRAKQKRHPLEWQDAHASLISFLDFSADAICLVSPDERIHYVNPSFTSMFDWESSELIGQKRRVLPPEWQEEFTKKHAALLRGFLVTSQEVPLPRKDGTKLDVRLSISPIRDAEDQILAFAATIRALGEQEKFEGNLVELAFYDPLTGAGNRRKLYSELQTAFEGASQEEGMFALLYLDCDRFKIVNDQMGHEIGDELLKQFASRVQRVLPEQAGLFRHGGDEFTVLLTGIRTKGEISACAEQLIQVLQESWLIEGYQFTVTCSIGISVYPFDGQTQKELLSTADQALYQAKAAGRNQFCFYQTDRIDEPFRRLLLENDLRTALETGHFHLSYQPRMDLESGDVHSLEVSLLYLHPEWGQIAPDEYLPICFENGWMPDYIAWISEQLGRQLEDWAAKGFAPIRFAVDLSQLVSHTHLPFQSLIQPLADSPLRPDCLEFVIQEDVYMEHFLELFEPFYELRELGVRVTLKGFGSGELAVDNLKHMPIDRVIVENSVWGSNLNDERQAAKVEGMVRSLQNETIGCLADGVDHPEMVSFAKQAGMDLGQGLCFSGFVSSQEVEDLGLLKQVSSKERVLKIS